MTDPDGLTERLRELTRYHFGDGDAWGPTPDGYFKVADILQVLAASPPAAQEPEKAGSSNQADETSSVRTPLTVETQVANPAPAAAPRAASPDLILLADALAIVQRWIDAYPVSVFPIDGKSLDCNSAAMGRHMGTCLLEELRAAALAHAQTDGTPDQEQP